MSILGILFLFITLGLTFCYFVVKFDDDNDKLDYGCLPLIIIVMWFIVLFKYWTFLTSPLW